MEAIVAVYQDWGIGARGTQPVVISADRKHFKELTEGAAIIVGRRTFADFPDGKPLPNRVNIVMSHQDIKIEGAIVVHSVEEALEEAKKYPRTIVVGGASVYDALLPFCDIVHVTMVDTNPKSDVFFPNLEFGFDWYCDEYGAKQTENGIKFSFCDYHTYNIMDDIKKYKSQE
ncbi:MAG: dihydrofolate reductase [Oscillospiraceae bacterium]